MPLYFFPNQLQGWNAAQVCNAHANVPQSRCDHLFLQNGNDSFISCPAVMQIGNCTDTGCCTSYPPPTPVSVSWMWESGLTQNSAPSTGRALAKFTLPSCSYAICLIVDKRLTRFWISLCDCGSNLTQFKSCASPSYRKKTLPYVHQGTPCFER